MHAGGFSVMAKHICCVQALAQSTLHLLFFGGLMGASLFCSHLAHCSCQHIQILHGTLKPLPSNSQLHPCLSPNPLPPNRHPSQCD